MVVVKVIVIVVMVIEDDGLADDVIIKIGID